MKNDNLFLGKQVLLTDWDWPSQSGPGKINGKIVDVISDNKLVVELSTQLTIGNKNTLNKIIISGRHKGYPIVKALPNKPSKFLSLIPFVSKFIRPLIAVNIYTEDNRHVSIANLDFITDGQAST